MSTPPCAPAQLTTVIARPARSWSTSRPHDRSPPITPPPRLHLEGNAVDEAWLDQDGIGTHVEAHTVALLRGARHPDEARRFIDFLLSAEIQTFLARLYGETPVNPEAEHGPVRPLSAIRRLEAALGAELQVMNSTVDLLRERGFETTDEQEVAV